ncbi:MAG: histidine kinase dimerization/phosphoacceptor domain -containing protein [Flavobacteriales bacterium]|nr:histidine kinase dimerization/phosphoacceptor domain -containing protein [Flavobacteriales bacterium]
MPTLIQKLITSPGDDLIVILELSGLRVRDCNMSFEMWIHSKKEDLIGSSFLEVLTVPQKVKLEMKILKNLNEHRVWVEELKKQKVVAHFHLIQWKKENLILCRIADHKKQGDQYLSDRALRHRIISEVSLESVVYVEGGKISDCNDQFVSLFGYTNRKEIIGMHLTSFFTPQDIKRLEARVEISNSNKIELRTFDKDGRPIFVEVTGSAIQGGDTVRNVFVLMDVTSRKKAEHALEQSVLRFRNLLENSPNAVLILTEGKIKYMNSAALALMGCKDEDELFDREYIGFVPEVLTGEVSSDMAHIRQGGDVPYKEIRLLDIHQNEIGVGIKSTLTVYENKPSIQVTLNNISLRMQLIQEQMRAELAEEINTVLKREIHQHKLTQKELVEQKAKLESIFNSTENLMMMTFDASFKLTSFNNNFRLFMQSEFDQKVKLEDNILEMFTKYRDPDIYQDQLELFANAFNGGNAQIEIPMLNEEGRKYWLLTFLNPVFMGDEKDELSCLMYDNTERKEIDTRIRESLKEKEILLQEVHHRVKNNLQVISSMLSLQSSFVKDPATLEILSESQQRIKSMSFVHETLYRTADFSSIDFKEYLRALTANLIHSYSTAGADVEFISEVDQINMPIDQAIPCGLIVNELISNSLKYAFVGRETGKLMLSLKNTGKKCCLKVKDNGNGLPKTFKYENHESLGIQLVYTLCEQLDAKIEIESKDQKGTEFRIIFGIHK